MAGKKDQSVVAVIDGLTKTQAANISSDILKAKNKHAPEARGTAAIGNRFDIKKNLVSGYENIKKLSSRSDTGGKKK
ncbi:MAG TPA: hypothetical protein PKW24_01495 [Clostridiales bacterium]|jgi:hypothetical protein|nr:hypothetical protein [Clostridiales bacterium]